MSVPKIMALRMGVYSVLVGYLLCDVFVFKGPLYKTLKTSPRDQDQFIAEAKASGIVARVYYRPIYRAQVEEGLKEYLWRRGRTIDDTVVDERRLLRKLIVEQLIDDELIKLQVKVSTADDVAVSKEEVARAVALEEKRYPDGRVFEELAKRAMWSGAKEREMRLAARIQRIEYLKDFVPTEVSDEEARAWFDENKESYPFDFEKAKESIKDALAVPKREVMWKKFRYEKLRHYAEGKIDLFDDVLYVEEGE